VLALMQANGVLAPRLNCVNSVSAITRLLRDGFGIGVAAGAGGRGTGAGELTLLDIDQRPPNLQVVVSWRVGGVGRGDGDVVSAGAGGVCAQGG
jgi:hypothetical protein